MSQDTNVKELVINQLTKEQYNKLKKENKLSKTELYIITDDEHYTNEEIVNLLKAKQNVLVTGDNIVISNNVISADLKRYAKITDTLYGYSSKLINLRENPDLSIQDSADRSCPTNYIKINKDLYVINVKTNVFSKVSPNITNKEWVKFTGGYYYNEYTSPSNVILLDQDGRLNVAGAKDWYREALFKDICGEVNTEYKELGLGISSSNEKSKDNKLFSIYKENNEIICNKISDINTWTKITGFVQNGYITNAYGIADGKLYEIRCNADLECETVLIDEESGWTNISGSSSGKYYSCIGVKNGKIYIINNGVIKLVNLNEDCSNAILCQQCGETAYFINNKKLYIVYLNVTDDILTPIKYFDNKEVYSYDLYYNHWVSSSIYHISNTDDSNYRYLYYGENIVYETSELNNIDKLYNFSNTNRDIDIEKRFDVAFVSKKIFYTKKDTDKQYEKIIAKIDYNKDKLYIYNYYNEEIAQVDIKISTDNTTVNYNDNNELQSIGEVTKNGLVKHTWIGTQEEYENDLQSGIIDETTEVLINDSVAEIITPQVEFNAPTKLSELANDMNFVDNTNLDNKVNEINTKINSKADDIDVVHVTGNEDIDGNKTFLNEINIKTGGEYTKIGHKNSTSNTPNLQDGYIKLGKDTLKFGEQNVQGEVYNVENDIFHSGNLTGGDGITIDSEDKSYKINIDKTEVIGDSVTLGSDTGTTTITGGSASSSSKMILNASGSSGSGDITISRTSDKINATNTYIDTMSVINTKNHLLLGTNVTNKNTYVKTNKLYRYNNKAIYEVLDENNYKDKLSTEIAKINELDTTVQQKQDKLTAGEGIKLENNIISSTGQASTGQGVPIGTVYPCLCTADYVPEGALPCDGTEYTKEQFPDLWNYFGKSIGIGDFELTDGDLKFNGRMARGTNIQVFITLNTIYLRRATTLTESAIVSTKNYTDETLSCSAIDEDNQRIVVVGLNGFTAYCDYANPSIFNWTLTRTDSINWTSVTFGNGLFVAVGGGKVAISSDGVNWDIQDASAYNSTGSKTSLYFNDVIYNSQYKTFIAVGAYGCVAYYSDMDEAWTFHDMLSDNTMTEYITEDLERIVYNDKHDVYIIMGTSKDKLYLATFKSIIGMVLTPITVTGRDTLTPLYYTMATVNDTVVIADKYTIRWCNNFFDDELISALKAYSVSFSTSKDISYAPEDCTFELDTNGNPTFYTWGNNTLYKSVLSDTLTGALLPTCTYTKYQTAISTYGSCIKFGIDLTNEKFLVPTIKNGDYITQAKSNDVLNREYKESLPNIRGTFNVGGDDADAETNLTGAFYFTSKAVNGEKGGVGGTDMLCGFNATLSSSTYQNGAKVQGDNVCIRYFVQVSNGTISNSAMDWSEWASNLQSKSNTDLNNLSDVGKKVIDGQWVHSYSLANSNATKGVYSIDLSDYLPDNTYWYEISATLQAYTSSSSLTNGMTEIANFLNTSASSYATINDSRNFFYLHIEYDDYNENIDLIFRMIIPPNNQTIYKSVWSTNSNRNNLYLVAYRRLGTNK